MKVGIVTLQEADNYGAVLQAYALQKVIESLGAESELVVFEQEYQNGNAVTEELGKAFIPLAKRIKTESEKRSDHFAYFRKMYLKCSGVFPRERVHELDRIYDVFIAGSDQIWNFSIPGVDGRYFLPFVNPHKRFSYAASFGGKCIPKEMREWCIQNLQHFQALSVREESGRRMIKELTGRDSVVCLDPVFLLGRTEWEKLASKTNEKPYILLYLIQYNKQAIRYIQKLASERNLELHIITASFMYPCGFQPWSGTDVVTWLSLIKNAEFIFTNSFHGIAFSMLFERPFSAIPLEDYLSDRNERIDELLKRTGMEKSIKGEPIRISEQKLEQHLGRMKQISYDYLREIISI